MLKGTNEGILIEINDFDKDMQELKEKIANKSFFKPNTDFIITKENKKYFHKIWEIIDKAGHNLYIIKESFKDEAAKKIEPEEKTLVITKQNFRIMKNSEAKQLGTARASSDNVALRSGKKVEFDGNVVVIGDVNPGAEIIASGDIYVFGRAKGLLHAGKDGDESKMILALSMEVNQLRIAGVFARSSEEIDGKGRVAEIAFLDENKNLIIQEFKAL